MISVINWDYCVELCKFSPISWIQSSLAVPFQSSSSDLQFYRRACLLLPGPEVSVLGQVSVHINACKS